MDPASTGGQRTSCLSKLSPEQVARASFIPEKPLPTSALRQPKPCPSPSPSLDGVVSSLAQRVEKQEARIKELEEELKKHQLECQLSVTAPCTPGHCSSTAAEPVLDLLAMAAVEEERAPTAPADASTDLLRHSDQSSSRPSDASSPPPTTTTTTVVDTKAFNTKIGADTMATAADNAPYLTKHWEAFESHLNTSRVAAEYTAADPPKDGVGTLIEGIGSIEELTLHDNATSKPEQKGLRSEPQPWDGTIAWSQDCPDLFDDGVICAAGEGQDNVYRTVAISNLPLRMQMKTLFKGIRGGEVYSAHLSNMEHIAGYHMGIVTFVRQEAAVAYAVYAAKNGIYFDGQRATVVLLRTPTCPMTEAMEDHVFRDGHTRCISVRGAADPYRYDVIFGLIRTRHPMLFDLGDRMVENTDETEVTVRLNSIDAAQRVLLTLSTAPGLSGCEFRFAPDPCAQPFPDGSEEGH